MEAVATWGQQTGESDPAWTAFTVYRDAGPVRSLRIAAQELGKSTRLLERWSTRWEWVKRAARWDLEQQDLRKEARVQAISDTEERHGKLARAVLGRVAAELGAHHKGRCQTCGRAPAKLAPAQVTAWMKLGVEVERRALGLGVADRVVTMTSVTNLQASDRASVVSLRDPESRRLASDLFRRMKALDPATDHRRSPTEPTQA